MEFLEKMQLLEREFSGDERKALAASGKAMPDGSFPIENIEDLHNAIQAHGRAKNPVEVKAHIKKRARELGASDCLPDSWKESTTERRIFANLEQLDEAASTYAPSTGNLTITVIKPGISKNNRYYSADLLKRSAGIFESAKMFTDHATDKEAAARPEGSVRDWVGTVNKVMTESDGTIKAVVNVHDPVFKESLSNLKKAGNLNQMGISIRAMGEATKGKVGDKDCLIVESLLACKSVDFVTIPAAGGQVESMSESVDPDDVMLMDLDTLKAKRPDLVEALTRKAPTKYVRKNNGVLDDTQFAEADSVTPHQRELIKSIMESEGCSEAEAYMQVTGVRMPDKIPTDLTEAQVREYKFCRLTGISESDALKIVKITGGYR